MSMNLQSVGGGRKKRGYRPLADINVTPFIDITLVLLIIFMVSAPLLNVGVPVDLPKANAGAVNSKSEPLIISISLKGDVYVQDKRVELEELIPTLDAISKNNKKVPIQLRADRKLSYGKVMEVLALVNTAGFTSLAMIAEVPEGKSVK